MLRTAFALLTGGLIGKLLGIVRELMLAAAYGTGAIAAGYRLAQTVVLVPVNFLTADLINAAIIPLQKKRALESEEEEVKFVWILIIGFFILGVLLTVGVFSASDYLVARFAPGADELIRGRAVRFVKILAICIPLYILGGVLSYVELGRGGVKLSSSRATFQNVGLVLFTGLGYYVNQPDMLAWGFIFAYVLFFFWGMLRLKQVGLLKKISISRIDVIRALADIWGILKPFCWLPFFLQGNAVVERIVASRLGGGAIAAVDYARLIADTGNILLTVPISIAILSELSGKTRDYGAGQLRKIIPLLSLLTVPTSIFIYVHAVPIVQVMYKHGAFNDDSVRVTSAILAPMGLGFFMQSFSYVFQKALSAQMRNSRLIVFTAASFGFSILTNYFGYPYIGVAVLGCALSVYGALNATLGAGALGLSLKDFSVTFLLFIGGIIYIAAVSKVHGLNGLSGLLIAVLMSAVFWTAWILIIPTLRRTALPVFIFMKNKNK